MTYIILQVEGKGYYTGGGFTYDALKAERYPTFKIWHEEKRMRSDIDKLEEQGNKVTRMLLTFEVRTAEV